MKTTTGLQIIAAASFTALLTSCASDGPPRQTTMTSTQFRDMYPRQYYETLDPQERREEDLRQARWEWEQNQSTR
jgi:hypothetical protein